MDGDEEGCGESKLRWLGIAELSLGCAGLEIYWASQWGCQARTEQEGGCVSRARETPSLRTRPPKPQLWALSPMGSLLAHPGASSTSPRVR